MILEIFLTQKNWSKPNLQVLDSAGTDLSYSLKRVFSSVLTSSYRHTSLQYKGNQLSATKRMFLSLKYYTAFFQRNKKIAIAELLFGFRITVSLEEYANFPLSISEKLTGNKYWVSRNCSSDGIVSDNLSSELEWSRERFPNIYSGFIWDIRLKENRRALGMNKIANVPIQYALPRFSQLQMDDETLDREMKYRVLHNCEVVGGLYAIEDEIVYHLDKNHRVDDNSWPTNLLFHDHEGLALLGDSANPLLETDKAILFGSSSSWFHFLVEILPRYLLAPMLNFSEFDVIVRGYQPASILEILGKFGFKSIITLHDAQVIRVKELVSVTDVRYQDSLVLTERKSDLTRVREFLSRDLDYLEEPKQIYIARPSNLFRPLLNRKKLEGILLAHGFHVVHPEQLSAVEQIQIFSDAELVVAESGAAMTNLMFMKKNAIVIEIHPVDDVAGFWGEFGKLFGVTVLVSNGKQSFLRKKFTKSDGYRINLRSFEKLLKDTLII